MRSYGQLWEKIVAEENLLAAWERVRRGHGNSQEVAVFAASLEENLAQLRHELVSGTYRPGVFRQFHILDPKPRTISCAPVRDRVVHHALCGVITPLLEKSFSHVSYACRVGYGSHKACQMARRYAGRYRYFCKLDIRHYFDSIDHERLLAVLLPKFREQAVRDLIARIVEHPIPGQPQGVGLPIGNLTSQWFANAFLDELDHLATAGFGNGDVAYLRYMDDFVFFADSKAKCWEMHDAAKAWLKENRGLGLKEDATVVAPVTEGIPFLGLRIFPNCWRLKRERYLRSRRTYARRERQFQIGEIDERRFAQCAASSDGALQWFGFKGILASGTGADSGNNRIQRGGYFNNDNNNCRSSNRNNNPSNRNNNIGFRLLSTPSCKGPARDACASHTAETNMQQVGWPVASANATPNNVFEKGVPLMGRLCSLLVTSLLSLLSLSSLADTVHLYECQSLDGAISTNAVRTLDTGRRHLSSTAPTRSGWLFTHWTISTQQAFANRDAWGRSYDAVPVMLYEDTTLTAHYVPASRDSDGDGVADGRELYWYGNFGQTATSDTDGDGKTFAQEIAAGTNPLLPQYDVDGPVKYADGDLWLYNPNGYAPYTIKSEPEGALFATTAAYVKPGSKVTSGTYGTATAKFAYWKINGVAQRDAWGRALDVVSLAMPEEAVEIVAVTATGDSDGDGIEDRLELYWYGDLDETGASDTDGDGKTFAQEIAAGTNPLLAQYDIEGPVKYVDGELWQYNPYGIQPYTVKSDPEGELFETTTAYVKQGTKVTSGTYGTATGFAYWKINGVEQRDAWGRACDAVAFAMPGEAVELTAVKVTGDSDGDGIADNIEFYWYGDLDEAGESDTDGDGKTFAEELAAGTNPLLAQWDIEGPVKYADSDLEEMNLQPYEQPQGALVDGNYVQLFTSAFASNNATSVTFDGAGGWQIGGTHGAAIWPVVSDVNDDGLWDLIVCSETATNVFVNVGSKGNPQFRENEELGMRNEEWWRTTISMNSTAKLETMALDVEPIAALSATTNGTAMLVSDEDGRIWLYERGVQDAAPYQLQHKVWGGSYAGFAQGLRLAAVDWEEDGDLDCLCGMADGKLMLLRDPKVGRPTNLKADAGVDNVLLTWDPNAQSRVRGYKVYRDDAKIASPALPTYRDMDLAPATYAYKVSALSRFYTAGNSTPTENESIATEPVVATVGGVKLSWSDPVKRADGYVEIVLSINNSLNYDATGLVVSNIYDTARLAFLKVESSGLSEKLTWVLGEDGEQITSTLPKGVVTLRVTGGEVAAGAGVFFTFVFDDLTVEPEVLMGDLDGDGKLTVEDVRLLARLKNGNGRKPTAAQIKAGDFNGNGKLDNADYQALRELLKNLGEL